MHIYAQGKALCCPIVYPPPCRGTTALPTYLHLCGPGPGSRTAEEQGPGPEEDSREGAR